MTLMPSMHFLKTIGLGSRASREYARKVHTTAPAHKSCSLPTNYAISFSLWHFHWLVVVSRSRLHWSAFYLKNKYFQLLPVLPIEVASFCEVKSLYNDDCKVWSIFGSGPGVFVGCRIFDMRALFIGLPLSLKFLQAIKGLTTAYESKSEKPISKCTIS